MYYYQLTLQDECWNLFWCWNRSVQDVCFYSLSPFFFSLWCMPELISQIFVLAVLVWWKFELPYILPHICCFQHNWLREEFPWVDEWFYSKVFRKNSWKYISSEVSGLIFNLVWSKIYLCQCLILCFLLVLRNTFDT